MAKIENLLVGKLPLKQELDIGNLLVRLISLKAPPSTNLSMSSLRTGGEAGADAKVFCTSPPSINKNHLPRDERR